MKLLKFFALAAMLLVPCAKSAAQQGESMYGDAVKADVKMNYVYTMEDALREAHRQNKPIFFNCFADWAVPCHVMNKEVFSNQEFCDYMNKNFVNLFMDMTKKEARGLAKKYNVLAFAHYLVLDKEGNILMRIVGGKRVDEFKECVALALSPKTSLAGTEAVYKSGKYKKKDLYNYSRALRLANENERFREIAKEYVGMLSQKERFKAQNWDAFTSQITSRDSEYYKFLVANKAKFEKQNGAKKVNSFLETCFFPELYQYASGSKPYDATHLLDTYKEMLGVGLPDTCSTLVIYQIAKLRGEERYDELYAFMNKEGDKLGRMKYQIEMTFDFPNLNEDQKTALSNYFMASAKDLPSHLKSRMESKAQLLIAKSGEGIAFEGLKFEEALAKAKAENKLVFMDCYTSWCGPCRMMDKDVFPLAEAGAYFNPNFVCIKKDMENGEGPELAKRYKVSAFPTMLILNPEGEVLHTILGARDVNRLIEEAQKGVAASK